MTVSTSKAIIVHDPLKLCLKTECRDGRVGSPPHQKKDLVTAGNTKIRNRCFFIYAQVIIFQIKNHEIVKKITLIVTELTKIKNVKNNTGQGLFINNCKKNTCNLFLCELY